MSGHLIWQHLKVVSWRNVKLNTIFQCILNWKTGLYFSIYGWKRIATKFSFKHIKFNACKCRYETLPSYLLNKCICITRGRLYEYILRIKCVVTILTCNTIAELFEDIFRKKCCYYLPVLRELSSMSTSSG